MKKFIHILLVMTWVLGGCGKDGSSPEESAHNAKMEEMLSRATRGDLVLMKKEVDYSTEDRSIGVVRWNLGDELGIGFLDGRFFRLFVDGDGYRFEDVILKDDPRWPYYRDRLLFGEKATSQPATTQSSH